MNVPQVIPARAERLNGEQPAKVTSRGAAAGPPFCNFSLITQNAFVLVPSACDQMAVWLVMFTEDKGGFRQDNLTVLHRPPRDLLGILLSKQSRVYSRVRRLQAALLNTGSLQKCYHLFVTEEQFYFNVNLN